jgi:hypothetical protein
MQLGDRESINYISCAHIVITESHCANARLGEVLAELECILTGAESMKKYVAFQWCFQVKFSAVAC